MPGTSLNSEESAVHVTWSSWPHEVPAVPDYPNEQTGNYSVVSSKRK